MPASILHLNINFERIKEGDDEDLKRLLSQAEQAAQAQLQNMEGRKPRVEQVIWANFVKAADEAKIAHRIPGSVGRRFKEQYRAEHRKEQASRPASRRRRITLDLPTTQRIAWSRYTDSTHDPVTVQFRDGALVVTSRPDALRTLDAMAARATEDISIPSREATKYRNALKDLKRRIEEV